MRCTPPEPPLISHHNLPCSTRPLATFDFDKSRSHAFTRSAILSTAVLHIWLAIRMYSRRNVSVHVPAGLGMGQIIGKQGSNIKHLQSRSCARMSVDSATETVRISGSAAEISFAVKLLEAQFACWRSSGELPTFSRCQPLILLFSSCKPKRRSEHKSSKPSMFTGLDQLHLQLCVSCSRVRVSAPDGGQVCRERSGELKDADDIHTSFPR